MIRFKVRGRFRVSVRVKDSFRVKVAVRLGYMLPISTQMSGTCGNIFPVNSN